MKKIKLLLVCCMLLCITGCKKKVNPLIGEWKYSHEENEWSKNVVFNSDGTMKAVMYDKDGSYLYDLCNGRWKSETDNTISLWFADDEFGLYPAIYHLAADWKLTNEDHIELSEAALFSSSTDLLPFERVVSETELSKDIAPFPGDWNYSDTIMFGEYEQDGNYENGKEPIEWIVIAQDDSRRLLVSKYILDYLAYEEEYTKFEGYAEGNTFHVTNIIKKNPNNPNLPWDICSLRSWLNNDFYSSSFSADERRKILNAQHIEWHGYSFGVTEYSTYSDYVFIPSPRCHTIINTITDDYVENTPYSRGVAAENGMSVDEAKGYWINDTFVMHFGSPVYVPLSEYMPYDGEYGGGYTAVSNSYEGRFCGDLSGVRPMIMISK